MHQTDSVFSYIYARKPPTITYKRKQKTYGNFIPRPLTPVTDTSISQPCPAPLSSTNQYSSPTELTPTSTDDEKENTEIQNIIPSTNHDQPSLKTIDLDSAPTTENDIFDLPYDDNNDTLVEIRVASSLHSSKKNKSKNANINGRHKSTNKKAPKPTPNANSTSHLNQKRNTKQTSTKTPPSFSRTLSAPTPTITNNTKPITPLPIARNLSMLPRVPDMKKRKRNLVSQLKAANGERPDFTSSRFNDVASDDDDDTNIDSMFNLFNQNNDVSIGHALNGTPLSTPSTIPTEPTTCLNDYNDRMEQELAALMRTEFGQEDGLEDDLTALIPSSSSSQRSRYVPENTIRAPVTYKRLNNNGNKSTTPSSSTMPLNDLDQQIQYLLSGDF